MLQRDPLKQRVNRRFTWVVILFGVLAIFYIVLNSFEYITSPASHKLTTFLPALFMVFAVGCYGLILVLLKVVWKRRNPKRQRALEGDHSLLFPEQPAPNASALTLPTTLELRVKWTLYYIVIAVSLITFAGVTLVFISMKFPSRTALLIFLSIVGGAILLFLLLFLLTASIAMRRARQVITVTEQGITTRYLGKTTTVPWSEACFFCVNGVAKQKRALVYELSSEKESVLWTRLFVPKGFIRTAMLKPTIPFEEYDQKMRALVEVVAGRTGLPLYDLRDTSNKWYM